MEVNKERWRVYGRRRFIVQIRRIISLELQKGTREANRAVATANIQRRRSMK